VNYLIAGLGNIGSDYENTRHNIGFDVVDMLAHKHDVKFKVERLAYKTVFKYKGRSFHLIKPTTYMNLSGKSVRYWMQQTKVPLENVLVVMDDLSLPFGKLRLRSKGSDAGHNGLKNINLCLNTTKYARLRFGIGNDFGRGRQINYVLGKWTKDEAAELPNFIDKAVAISESFGTIGIARTMNLFN
jgi:PTH1 family peptidyl-tRNA hydrolase